MLLVDHHYFLSNVRIDLVGDRVVAHREKKFISNSGQISPCTDLLALPGFAEKRRSYSRFNFETPSMQERFGVAARLLFAFED